MTFSSAREVAQQLEVLEYEAHLPCAQGRARVLVERKEVFAIDAHGAAGREVQARP